MTAEGESNKVSGKAMKNLEQQGRPGGGGRKAQPDWASGLRRMYDSVVEEPLPDSFAKLLKELDGADD